ncbi:MAG: hypothetical protein LAP86_11730 [Acidobacteriia bacterium]|nr:hypothetical protein [Terriglobia bacterium]
MKDQLKLLQSFLAAGKPDWVETIDILLTAHLIARADAKMACRVSWETLGKCSKVNRSTVYRSVARL